MVGISLPWIPKILDPNSIAAPVDTNSGIKNVTGEYDDRNVPTPIFTINPVPEVEPDDEHKDSEEYDYDGCYDYYYDQVEEVEPPEEDTP